MSFVINTNVSSLNAQNNLDKSRNMLAQATQRLSSGLKINSAADNAAGFAISQRYTTQIGALSQASANASDAINLAQTAGSALDQVTANLQAIRDLAAQSANGTYSSSDRATIDKEVQQRLAEITRIANQTTFNGKKVLDGSLSTQSFQVGADVGQTISVSLGTSVKAASLGTNVASVNTGDLSNAFVNSSGGTLDSSGNQLGIDLSKLKITAGGSSATGIQVASSGTAYSVQDVADAINSNKDLAKAGVAAAVDGNGGLSVFYTAPDKGDQLTIADTNSVSADSKLGGGTATTMFTSTSSANGVSGTAYTQGTAVDTAGSLDGANVTTVDNANALITRIDSALGSVADFASQLGAVQNRFQSTISTLAAQSTNLKASQSTIQDADFAAETANLSKAQVLQQAGISVLSQANSQPQQILKLLQ